MFSSSPNDLDSDFRKRFLSLLSFKFREFAGVTALSITEAANGGVKDAFEEQAGSFA
jgi:N-acetyltransferase 10